MNQYLLEFPNGVKRTYIYTHLPSNFRMNTMLAGLCNICDDFGYSNFDELCTFIEEICTHCPGLNGSTLIKDVRRYETFLKTKFSKLTQKHSPLTSNVIYLIECVKCSDQYVGETGHPAHHRGTQHRSDIKGGTKNIPSVRHFKNCGVQNLKLTVIERVRKQDQDIRKAREKYWILRLKPSINNLVV